MSQGKDFLPKSIQDEMQRMDDFEKKHDAQMNRDNRISVLIGIAFVLAMVVVVLNVI